MKVLVTGGSGYLGTHLVRHFGADDLSRRSGRDVVYESDCSIAAEYDVVIHLAAEMDRSPENADSIFRTNTEGAVNVLMHMRENAVFIFASTKDVYGRFAANYDTVPETCSTAYSGQTPLEWSKLIAERYVEYYTHQLNIRSCIFRLSTIYAPNSEDNLPNFVGHYARQINIGERIRLPGGGRPRRDILHVDDLAAACEAFTDSAIRHGLYNIGGGQSTALPLRELVAKMEEVSGLEALIDEDDPLPDPVPMNYVSDITLADHELGWRPTIGIEEGIKTLF
jgi:nucleoside-diphosphate-sugar epimerase